MKDIFRINNFDLIRLLAALQVALTHSAGHLKLTYSGYLIPKIFEIVLLFPGVPIFFFISGFLISKSYENCSRITEYFKNRMLRIYPALIVCIILSIISVILSGYFKLIIVPVLTFMFWVFSQITFFQFYNPEFMRHYGVGVLNGSLWTISVEIQFYIIIPILYKLLRKINDNKSIIIVIIVFAIINSFYSHIRFNTILGGKIWFKLIGASFLPWLYMFLIGVFFQQKFSIIYKYINGKLLYILPVYALFTYILSKWCNIRIGNTINPFVYLMLAVVIFAFAYSYKNISNTLIKRNDISYGVYLYHMPICNLFIFIGWYGNFKYLLLSILCTCILSIMSWFIIEKPSIALKRYSINPINLRRITFNRNAK